jgi:hypothetical protein
MQQTTRDIFEAYNHALQYGPQSEHKGSPMLDVAVAVIVGLMLAVGALSYFDVLVK